MIEIILGITGIICLLKMVKIENEVEKRVKEIDEIILKIKLSEYKLISERELKELRNKFYPGEEI